MAFRSYSRTQCQRCEYLNATYTNGVETLPLSYEIVEKTEVFTDKKTGKEKRRSTVTKNTLFRTMLDQAIHNNVQFTYVLADIWFSSVDNMKHIDKKGKTFIMPLKSNRSIAKQDKGPFQAVSDFSLEHGAVKKVYLKGLSFPVLLTKQVFTNKDDSTGTLYLVTNDETLDHDSITTHYQKRWKVEEFHKSLKSNLGLAKSPTKTVRTQSNHFFASMCAYIKLERLSWKRKKNHFALKAELYMKALRSAYGELEGVGSFA